MYDILYAPIVSDETADDWAILESNIPTMEKAGIILAAEMVIDISGGDSFAYRLVEHGKW